MTTIFGNKAVFAFVLKPLNGPPEEADASAASTWASLELWVEGRNLTAHTHLDDGLVHQGLHWPVVYISRWLVRSWPSLFEKQGWPIAGSFRNARSVASELDTRLIEDIDDEQIVDVRDDFIRYHSLLAAAAGGLVPDVYVAHDGNRVSVSWASMDGQSDVRFHHQSGESDVPTTMFLDAVKGLVGWTATVLASRSEPQTVNDHTEFEGWLEHLDSPASAMSNLAGFVGIASDKMAELVGEKSLEDAFGLPQDWQLAASAFDATTSWPAVVFRATRPVLTPADVLSLVERLRSVPACSQGRLKLEELRLGLPTPTERIDFMQGYALAEFLRKRLANEDGHFDVERFVRDELELEVIDDLDIDCDDIDGGAVWDAHRGPALFVNSGSGRAATDWGRRMVLAHELCHLLFDAREAVPLTVISGPWTPPVIERRANAFAAELLLPLAGIQRVVGSVREWPTESGFSELMDEFGVGVTMCREHVRNRKRLNSYW